MAVDMRVGDVVEVRFGGGQTRVGPLTVGQANMRRCVLRDDPAHMNACLVWPLPPGTSLDRIASLLATLVQRHESLRTTYPQDPELRQVVAAEGALTMTVHPEGVAADIGPAMRAVRFDPPVELPLRIAVVTVAGEPTTLVLVLCHMAVDAAAIDLLGREWADLVAGRPLPPPAATQPVDLALMEHTARGRRRLVSSVQYWDKLLRATPQAMFAVPGVRETDWMHRRLRVRSRAAAVALDAIAARTGASRPTIVLAAMCALLGRRLDQRTFVVAMLAANRFLAELTDYVGTVAQDALMSVELDADTFDEIVRRVRSRSVSALRHSWFDYEELLPVIRGAERDRGTHWARDCVFNDLTALHLDGLLSMPGGGPPSGGVDPWLDWAPPESMLTRLMLWAVRLDGEVELALWADERCLSEQDAEEFVLGVVRLLVAAADRDVDLTDIVPAVDRGAGWYRIDSSWIDIAAVQRLVADVLPGRPSLVAAVPDELLGHRIDCYLAGADVPDLAAVHADCLAALAHRLSAMAPHRYVVCSRAPADVADVAAWRRQPVVTEGTGRASPVPTGVSA
jgi:hypothetical protein